MKLIIDELTTDTRIDVFLAEYMKDYSRSKIQSEIKKGAVSVNFKYQLFLAECILNSLKISIKPLL